MNVLHALVTGLALLAPLAAVAAPPAGFVHDESGCASGGPSTYFFEGGAALVSNCGDDCPVISEGTWSLSGATITVRLTRSFVGVGDTRAPGPVGARTIYERYKGAVRDVDRTETIDWSGPDGDYGCATVARHTETAGARAHLKGSFRGAHPYLSEREITKEELAGKAPRELELMRNEVYAAYGHIFEKPRFRDHFAKVPGYRPRFADVSAFLTPIEVKNVATIRAVEKAR